MGAVLLEERHGTSENIISQPVTKIEPHQSVISHPTSTHASSTPIIDAGDLLSIFIALPCIAFGYYFFQFPFWLFSKR